VSRTTACRDSLGIIDKLFEGVSRHRRMDIKLAKGNPDAVFTAIHPNFYSDAAPYLLTGVDLPPTNPEVETAAAIACPSRTGVKLALFRLPWKPDTRRAMDAWCAPHSRSAELTSTHQKRDTKKGPRRQEAGMAPPLPNSAHGDQLISAKPRGTAR
jgi:hypothetical protein